MAVVDPQLRVIGVEGLRVADTSIIPLITTGNLNAPAIMIGEKAADMILGRDAAAGLATRRSMWRPIGRRGSGRGAFPESPSLPFPQPRRGVRGPDFWG